MEYIVVDNPQYRRVAVLPARNKEQHYAMVALQLLPNQKYIMTQKALDKIRKTPAKFVVFDITPKSIPLSVQTAYPSSDIGIMTWRL